MIRFTSRVFATSVVIAIMNIPAISEDRKFTFEEIDKNKTLAEVFTDKKSPCPIVFIKDKPYYSCPNYKIEGLDISIDKFEAK